MVLVLLYVLHILHYYNRKQLIRKQVNVDGHNIFYCLNSSISKLFISNICVELSRQTYDYQISGKLLSPAVRKTPTDKQTTGWELIETFILRAWCVGLQVHISEEDFH